MKISPLAQGTGVPAASNATIGQTSSPTQIARAKAIASGQDVPRETSGDRQADRVQDSVKRIKMRVQRSTNRHEEPITEEVIAAAGIEDPNNHINEPTQETEETRPLSPQFAALAKAKRALQVKESELARREEALKTQAPAGQEDLIARLKANPLNVLQEAGVTYDQLTEAILNTQSAPIDAQKLRAELKEELLSELTGQFSTRDQQAEQQVLSDIKREALALTSQGDDFEAIRGEGAEDQVVKLVHKVWKEGWEDKGFPAGHILDTKDAAQIVEDFLIEESFKKAQYKKVQLRFSPQQVAAQTPVQNQNTKIMRTLTNRDTASPVLDKRARAIAAMQGTLKR